MMNDFVPIDILDRPRRLRFDIAACRALFEQTGKEVFELFPSQWGPGSVSLFLWAALRWEDPRLTKSAVDAMVEKLLIEGKRVTDLAKPINEAIDKSGLFRALAPPKANGHDPDPPSGGGSTPGAPSSTGSMDSTTSESKG